MTIRKGSLQKGALFSLSERCRYVLWRQVAFGFGRTAVIIGLNPSTADERTDDPTIRRCMRFAATWECDWLRMVNLFAHRATVSLDLLAQSDPVGADNDRILQETVQGGDVVVCAWGTGGPLGGRKEGRALLKERAQRVVALVDVAAKPGIDIQCLGWSAGGYPRHPLYMPADTKRRVYLARPIKYCGD